MIKKSVFEEDLVRGMQRELSSQDLKQGMEDLVKAADYLNAAIEIFEESNMTIQADQVLKILGKIAADSLEANPPEEKPEYYDKFLDWIKDPSAINSGDLIKMKSLDNGGKLNNSKDYLSFESLLNNDQHAAKDKTHDRHTKNLNSDKMVKNLLHHGTVFNLANDGKSEDLLNLDIDDNNLEINEDNQDFEDES